MTPMTPTKIIEELAKLNIALATAEASQQIAALAAAEHADDKAVQAAFDSANKSLDALNKRISTLRSALIAARAAEAAAKKKDRADAARSHHSAALKECRTVRPAIGKKLVLLFADVAALLRDYETSTERCREHAREVVRLCAVDHPSHMSAFTGVQDLVLGCSGSVNPAATSALGSIIGSARACFGFGSAVSTNAEGARIGIDIAIAVDGDRIATELGRMVETAEDRDAQPDDDQAAAA